ncbi:MAG: hypothetical protein R3B47_21155 [Bacteroidia bacterium]
MRGISWYRLKQIDMDGKVNIQPKVAVHFLGEHDALSYRAFPNPARDHSQSGAQCCFANDGSFAHRQYERAGAFRKKSDLQDGQSSHKIGCAELVAGIYLVQVNTQAGERLSFQLVKL